MGLTRISAFRNGPKRQVALVILGLTLLSHAAQAEGGQVNLAWDANIQSILGGYTQGRFGKALLFDGVNGWVTGNDAGSLDLTTGMTLEARANENPSHELAYGLYANTDTSQPAGSVYIGGDKNLHGGPWLFANTWVHPATAYNGSIQRLYVNSTEVANRAQPGPIEVSNRHCGSAATASGESSSRARSMRSTSITAP